MNVAYMNKTMKNILKNEQIYRINIKMNKVSYKRIKSTKSNKYNNYDRLQIQIYNHFRVFKNR